MHLRYIKRVENLFRPYGELQRISVFINGIVSHRYEMEKIHINKYRYDMLYTLSVARERYMISLHHGFYYTMMLSHKDKNYEDIVRVYIDTSNKSKNIVNIRNHNLNHNITNKKRCICVML